ncbi:MAG: acetyl-CoA carboxylase biotin carboxyl carrier protein [Acutalibacteraceae bacterium]|nr:acetyl-CoA carboxylase biotin carboxyl carrier protein [Acutalibacteraceae bacterium]
MYSIEEIKELIATLDNSSLTHLDIVTENGEKLSLKKKVAQPQVTLPVNTAVAPAMPMPAMPMAPVNTAEPAATEPAKPQGKTIDCPMVGVFYTSPSPEADPYVKVGTKVNKGDVVCIIEAMKLMNEVTATESGTIQEVLVENGDLVEFGQPLFVIA